MKRIQVLLKEISTENADAVDISDSFEFLDAEENAGEKIDTMAKSDANVKNASKEFEWTPVY